MSHDLHLHSTASDGALTPSALVAHVAACGVTTLALTDHDTVAGLTEARAAAQARGLAFINGIELSVTWQRRTLHIVGLGFDPDAAALADGIARLQAERSRRATAIADRLQNSGLANARARVRDRAGPGQITRAHFAQLLVEDGLARNNAQAFKRYLKPGRPGHVAARWASLAEAIGWLHAAGGHAVLAHPFGYGFTGAWRRRALTAFTQAGGDALEVATGTTTPEQIRQALADAEAFGLLTSQGSDFHSREQFWIRPGRMAVPNLDVSIIESFGKRLCT